MKDVDLSPIFTLFFSQYVALQLLNAPLCSPACSLAFLLSISASMCENDDMKAVRENQNRECTVWKTKRPEIC